MLDAAVELVLEGGVSGFSVDEVVRRSGVAKSTVYRHFSSRSELLVAALDSTVAVPAIPDTGTLKGDLLEFLEAVVPIFANEQVRAINLDVMAQAINDPELARVHNDLVTARSSATRTIYERAKSRGEIAEDVDFNTALEFMEGPLVARSLIMPETLADYDIAGTVERICLVLAHPGLSR